MEQFDIETEDPSIDESLASQFTERARKFAPILGPVVVDGVEMEIIEISFSAVLPQAGGTTTT